MVLHECPYCHRPFEAEELSKEEVDSSEATKVGEFPMESSLVGGVTQGGLLLTRGPTVASLVLGLSEEEKSAIAMKPEAFITYKAVYKCKHCGKEWSKFSVEAVPLPREYAEDEAD